MEDEKYENENFEDNIDDLLDYNDFESNDIENPNDLDSFNKDVIKVYEDHKKVPNLKGNEMLNNHRPISSYHRNVNTDNQNKNNLNLNNNNNNNLNVALNNNNNLNEENQNASNHNLNNNENSNNNNNLNNNDKNSIRSNSPPSPTPPLDFAQIISRLNAFIKKQKIKKEDFIESEEIFLSREDFRDLFRKIRFEISKDDINFLFSYSNTYAGNDFIRMKNFMQLSHLEFADLNPQKSLNADAGRIDMKRINEDFKNLHWEIFDIIKNDLLENANKEKKESANLRNFRGRKFGGLANTGANTDANRMSARTGAAKGAGFARPATALVIGKKDKNEISARIGVNGDNYVKSNLNRSGSRMKRNLCASESSNNEWNKDLKNTEDEEMKNKVSAASQNNLTSKMEYSENVNIPTNILVSTSRDKAEESVNYEEHHGKEEKGKIVIKQESNKAKTLNFLRNSIIKKKEEEENMKKKFKKEQTEFEADCKKKVNIANQMLKDLGMLKKYTSINDTDGVLRCLVEEFDKGSKGNLYKIELKAFVAEYRVLTKQFKKSHGITIQERPKTATNFHKNTANVGKLFNNVVNEHMDSSCKGLNSSNSNAEKKDFIKKILISAMKMKIKLKDQLEALKHNEVFPESLILSTLSFANEEENN